MKGVADSLTYSLTKSLSWWGLAVHRGDGALFCFLTTEVTEDPPSPGRYGEASTEVRRSGFCVGRLFLTAEDAENAEGSWGRSEVCGGIPFINRR